MNYPARLQSPTFTYCSAPSALAQSQIRAIDDNGGPGAHFTDIDLAVASPADGDTLLFQVGRVLRLRD